jgi:small subunit ribosomal protein S17
MTENEQNETPPEDAEGGAPDTATEEAAAEPAGSAPGEAAPAPEEPAEQLSPKERRKRARSTHAGEGRGERTAEERAAERADRRRSKARRRRVYRQRVRERRGSGGAAPSTPPAEAAATGRLKVRQGVVVSDGADKTITVRIDVARQHRMYKKIVRTSSTLHAHDEGNEAHVGDTVRVVESRPLSRTKRWRLVEVLERAR